jgi:hypothetical protein
MGVEPGLLLYGKNIVVGVSEHIKEEMRNVYKISVDNQKGRSHLGD